MTTRTTNHLYISRVDRAILWWHRADKVTLGGLVVIALVIALAGARSWLLAAPDAPRPAPTPASPIIMIATAPAQLVPTAAPPMQQVAAVLPNTLRRATVAYDAPEGNVLGAIEQGRAYSVLARYGADWLQADVTGSGVVWLRSADVLDLPADLADLQPPPAPVVIERPIYVSAPVEAVPTPAPAEYQIATQPQLTERQRNIQQHLVDPAVAQSWAAQQWKDEHCIGDTCIP